MKFICLAALILSLTNVVKTSFAADTTTVTKNKLRKGGSGSKPAQHHERKLFLDEQDGIVDQYIVILKDDPLYHENSLSLHAFDTLQATADGFAASVHASVKETYNHVFSGFVATGMSHDGAQKLAQNDRIKLVVQDGHVSLDAVDSWGLDRVDNRDLPLDGNYSPTFGNGGEGVTAYIIDTGIMISHDDYGSRATWGYNSVDSNDEDCNGHGTHVAGTVGGNVYGIANKVNLVGVKVLNCSGSGTWAGILQGIDWVKKDASGKKAVANLSLGGGKNAAIDIAIKALVDSGVTTVVAAGNSNDNACNYSPASELSAITVGSTDRNDGRSSFSNFGSCLDIFAPGRDIKSTYIGSNTATNTISGTSMASPHVCGAAALHLGNNPSATPAKITSLLVDSSTLGKVLSPGTGSPNRLLFVEGESGDNNCTDVPNWHDSDGPKFDCDWYADKGNCDNYGDDYAYVNMTANEACCVCGGGEETCTNTQNWHDSDGPEFDCEWYADKDNCDNYGDDYENFGQTANEACCTCKGD